MDCYPSNFTRCILYRSSDRSPERLVAKPRQYTLYHLVFPDKGSSNDNRQCWPVLDLHGRDSLAVNLKEKL
jgi:hypothetical protein